MIFYFRSLFAHLFLNAFMVYRLRRSPDLSRFLKTVLTILYIAETLLYFLGLFGLHRFSVETISTIQKITGIWVLFQLYLLGMVVIFDILLYWRRRKKFLTLNKFKKKDIKRAKFAGFILVVLLLILQLKLGYNNFIHVNIKEYTFSYNKPSGQQEPLHRYKMLVASDLHLGYIIDKKVLAKNVDLINRQNADIIVLNGDLIDFDLRPLLAQHMDEELKKLYAPKGVYFITGNHEYKFNPEAKLNWIANTGMTILKDSIANIDNAFFIIGRDDKRNDENRKSTGELLNGFDTGLPCVLFAHQPADIPDSYEYHIPLTICGHTHGGQVFPVNLFAKVLYHNPYGWMKKGDSYSYTTSGLGLSGIPLRIGSRSEIVIFNIEIY